MAGFPQGRSFVQAALDAVSRAGMASVDMRYFAAREGEPAGYCQQRVRACEIYVAVVGFRYGSLAPGTAESYTELEFREATAAGLPRLVFLLDEAAPEAGGAADANRRAVEAFRQRLCRAGLIVRFFTSGADLELEVFHALTELTGDRPVAVPQQLPAAIPHFAGRVQELASLDVLLAEVGSGARGTVVISAIRGTAGVGKTAVAVHWAHRVAGQFPHGQLYVNLRGNGPSSALVSPTEAIRGFLDALAVPAERIPSGADAQAGLFRSLLAGRKMLILLDNAKDAAQVRPLLPGTVGCLVLVTSRSRLTGLAAAEGAQPLTVHLFAEHEARDLLSQRLGHERVSAEPGAVAELITLSARLPLALSIAAARAAEPTQPLASLVAELRSERGRLDRFETGDPGSSLRVLFSWSYQNLSQPGARMFRLLSLHPGPDITAAAAASLAAITPVLARALITELADANLISESAPGRYAFHDLLRRYAADLAIAADAEAERRESMHRILDHYLHTACAGTRALNPARPRLALEPPRAGVSPEVISSPADALEWFSAERHVLIAATTWASGQGFDRHAWQLPWALALFFQRKGYWPDLVASQHGAIAAAQRLGDLAGQAHACRDLGWAKFHLGAFTGAGDCFHRALDLHTQLRDPAGQSRDHHDIAAADAKLGRFSQALEHAQRSLALLEGGSDQAGLAKATNGVGYLYAQLGDYEQGLAYCERALDLIRGLGDPLNEAATLDSVGYALTHLGRYAEAIDYLRTAAGMIEGLRALPWKVEILIHLGDACVAGGNPEEGHRAWQDALAIMDNLHHPDADQFRARLAQIQA